ncbi:MAG: hypothetical protein QXI61_06930, partial [Nitrososphaerota archaeon]
MDLNKLFARICMLAIFVVLLFGATSVLAQRIVYVTETETLTETVWVTETTTETVTGGTITTST